MKRNRQAPQIGKPEPGADVDGTKWPHARRQGSNAESGHDGRSDRRDAADDENFRPRHAGRVEKLPGHHTHPRRARPEWQPAGARRRENPGLLVTVLEARKRIGQSATASLSSFEHSQITQTVVAYPPISGCAVASLVAPTFAGCPIMLRRAFAFATIAIVGLAVQAEAKAPCQELVRLHNKASEAWKQAMRVPPPERCGALNQATSATQATLSYANNNRASCDISDVLLNQTEAYHREAVQTRDNACAGRPLRTYPAEIIQR